ncbi:hypothetical protein [Streptomyces olivaceoviridis]|uniref:hypothetical protein n=1 Tax=Streptomyces olivaceoviridis TaxID=1921 RepID=UPI0036B268E3
MPTLPALITETELADWLTQQTGPVIRDNHETAQLILTAFDLLTKDGSSLNNAHQIANCIASTLSTDGPFGPVDTAQAATTLHAAYRITRKPTDHAQLLVDLPMPVVVNRHQCPFCRRFTRADLRAVQDHMTRCWSNPRLRCCKTCTHHQDAGPYDDESCTHNDGPEYEEYGFPVLHCPLWQPKGA